MTSPWTGSTQACCRAQPDEPVPFVSAAANLGHNGSACWQPSFECSCLNNHIISTDCIQVQFNSTRPAVGFCGWKDRAVC